MKNLYLFTSQSYLDWINDIAYHDDYGDFIIERNTPENEYILKVSHNCRNMAGRIFTFKSEEHYTWFLLRFS